MWVHLNVKQPDVCFPERSLMWAMECHCCLLHSRLQSPPGVKSLTHYSQQLGSPLVHLPLASSCPCPAALLAARSEAQAGPQPTSMAAECEIHLHWPAGTRGAPSDLLIVALLTAALAKGAAKAEARLQYTHCKTLLTAKLAFTALQEQREAEALHQAMEHLILEAYSQLGKGSVDQAIQLLLEGGQIP